MSDDFSFLIRTARQPDLVNLAEVLASSFHTQDGMTGWLYPLLRAGIYEDLRSRFYSKAPYHACLVAAQRSAIATGRGVMNLAGELINNTDRAIGTVEISLRTRSLWQSPSRYLYLSNLAVQSDYRRQGIAQQLLHTCEWIALDWGFQDLYLHVLENNDQARRLYLKQGYHIQQAEIGVSTFLLGRPRQLLLRKRLVRQ